ncbi:MAG TPA: class I SAM-dependent methyltransferase, partial [Gemmatimonadaceae bacterium]|nr:class I SAM-dependent methyltransferase [Gemmatimonadaceae bacterium]
ATTLLYGIWQFSDCYAWGLVTANPFAVRALETATRRPCRASIITSKGAEVLAEVAKHVTYLPADLSVDVAGNPQPRVNTEFYVDHTEIPTMLRKAARGERRWGLGRVEEGEEWVACTLAEQRPDAIGDQELAELLMGADEIWIQAYERMTLDEGHAWHRHESKEIDYILENVPATGVSDVIDVGCGDGRHAHELAKRGYAVLGVDISSRLIERAKGESGSATKFEILDARGELPEGRFDLALCLYDVIGSSARAEDDLSLVRNIARSLRPGGHLAASVLNTDVTLDRLPFSHRPTSNNDFVAALETLPPSSAMEQSGSIFDPEHLLHYQGVYYRKEQFEQARWRLPTELVVRDRRFSEADLFSLLERGGFEVLGVRPVQAGAWEREPALSANDTRAKELLAIARLKS